MPPHQTFGKEMKISLLIAFIALIIGGIFGWSARDYFAAGHKGIQWDLNDAARRGDINEMKRLVSSGANPLIEAFDENIGTSGGTPLFEAASSGEPEAVEFLIQRGADVNIVEATETPLDMARYRRSQADKTITLLVEKGAKGLSELQKPSKAKE